MDTIRRIIARLKKKYPRGETFLDHHSVWELVVATQLSAQCTDARVNRVTKKLFKKYRRLREYCDAKPAEFQHDIFSTGFYKNKTRNILAAARMVRDEFDGVVPNRMADLIRIPGIGRKTANVVLSQGFGLHEGIAVDTHVTRLAQRLGLSKNRTPEKIERDLMDLVAPHEYWGISTALILHGRSTCHAKNPACASCFLAADCPSAFKFKKGAK